MIQKAQPVVNLRKSYAITAVDEATHTVYGIATEETPDSAGEICDYADTKPLYKAWAARKYAATTRAGQEPSHGNVRLQHSMQIAGKVTGHDYFDDEKVIKSATQPVDDAIWQMIAKGFITGYSHGGSYVYRKCNKCGTSMGDDLDNFVCPKCKVAVLVRYAVDPIELSYVDSPCLSGATFEFIKSNGMREVRKFATAAGPIPVSKVKAQTKRVAGEDLTSSAFAYVGNAKDTSTWHLPIKFSTTDLTKKHIRAALSMFDRTKGIPESEKPKVKARIVSAARHHGIETTSSKSDGGKPVAYLKKGMYEVGSFARTLGEVQYLRNAIAYEGEYEGDPTDEEISDKLADSLAELGDILKQYVANEVDELTAAKKAAETKGVNKSMKPNGLLAAVKAGLSKHHTKAAVANGSIAETHKAMAEECAATAESLKAECDDDDMDDKKKKSTKALAAHFKALAKSHTTLAKQHAALGDHHTNMATDVSAIADTGNEPAVGKAETVPAAAPVADPAPPVPAAAPAVAPAAVTVEGEIQGMVKTQVTEMVKAALAGMGSDPGMQDLIKGVAREQVVSIFGGQVQPTASRQAPVAIPRGAVKAAVAPGVAVPLDLEHLAGSLDDEGDVDE